MSDDKPIVELEHVSFGYPPAELSQPVLTDVSLQVVSNDFLGIIGPNGGGKTTLLKLILGLLTPQRGTVHVFGKEPRHARNRIGYVPQHAKLDASVPVQVLDVVLMGRLGRSRWGWHYRRDHVHAAMTALEQTATADLAQRPIGELSGGQMQRVLIARALAGQAELLLLDEPTANVDPHTEQGLTDLLHQLNQRLPIVIVSHDVSFVSTHLKHIACVGQTVVVHDADHVTVEVLGQAYHDPVRVMRHDHDCALHDPGCKHGCETHDLPHSATEPPSNKP